MVDRLLVATAVPAERDAILAGLTPLPAEVTVAVVGVGPVASAAGTARLLTLAECAGTPYRWVVSAGIGGGFAGRVAVGGTVLASRSVAADLGVVSADGGFTSLDALGFGRTEVAPDPDLHDLLRAALPDAVGGSVLTVGTVTGTAEGASTLLARYPDAAAEAMEGFAVGSAAALAGAGFAEVRMVSNAVGPRDRAAWRIADALAVLTAAAPALVRAVPASPRQ